MIWHCRHCGTLNSNTVSVCAVCDNIGSPRADNDMDILEIHFVTIFWYMKAEVENRLHNTQVMSLNGYNLMTSVR